MNIFMKKCYLQRFFDASEELDTMIRKTTSRYQDILL